MTHSDLPRSPDLDAPDVPWAWMLNMPTVDEWLDSLNPLDDEDDLDERSGLVS